MILLPHRFSPVVYGVIQAAITTGVATAIATWRLAEFDMRLVENWLATWAIAWLTMLPVVVFVAPLIQRFVRTVTAPQPAVDRS